MLQVARECSGRDSSDLQLSYGEFCLISKELQKCYQNQNGKSSQPLSLGKPLSKNAEMSTKNGGHIDKTLKSPKPVDRCQVFLGGSCNPTTWRKDVAIPMLNHLGITFYNPQVLHWEESLLEAENLAKKEASVLFFVFDPSTRNVASMVEAGFVSGCQRKVMVVINQYSGPGQLITGEAISQSEYEELSSGLIMVQDLLERQGVPVFSQINHALACTAKVVKENIWPQDLDVEEKVLPVRYSRKHLKGKLMKLHEAFISMNSNRISLSEASDLFKIITNRGLTQEEIKTIVASKKGVKMGDVVLRDSQNEDVGLSFEEFCCIVAEFENQPADLRRLWDVLSHSLAAPIHKIVDRVLPTRRHSVNGQRLRDVYLGGAAKTNAWRDSIAAPLLKKHSITFYSPFSCLTNGRLSPSEKANMDACRLLLFVISNTGREVAQITLAAHYVGLGFNVVLCVQMLTQGCVVDGQELSAAAVKDYNRGRSYLIDLAKKENIPIFSDVTEALQCVVQQCGKR